MADQNDMKVGVLADLADIEQQGVRAGEAFKKGFVSGFGPGGIGGALLGNGMAPTQGTQGPGDSVTGILDRILQSLQTGFGRMLEAAGGGLGGGASTRDPGGTFFKGGYDYTSDKKQAEPPGGGGGGGGGGSSMRSAVGAAGAFPQQSYANMYGGGFYQTDIAKFAAAATSNIPLVGQFMGVISDTMGQRDGALRDSLGVFRGGGVGAWQNFHGMMTGNGQLDQQNSNISFMKQYGVARSEAAQLQQMASQSGFSKDNGSFNNLVQLQGLYGMGQQGANLMGTVQQSGGGKDGQTQLFANVLATALGQNLDRGRWGEMFGVIGKSVERMAQTGEANVAGALGTANFVGSMGERFKGDTASAGSMTGMLHGMQGGQGGAVGNLFAMQAAGLDQPGVSYQMAWARVQRGSAKGGVKLQTVLKQIEQLEEVQAYIASGSEEDLSAAMHNISMLLPGYKPTDIEALLRSMRSEGYQDGSVFKGPAANHVSQMSNALKKGKIPRGAAALTGADIEKSMRWNPAVLSGPDAEAAGMLEEKFGKKAADQYRKDHEILDDASESFPDQPESGGGGGGGGGGGAGGGGAGGGAGGSANLTSSRDQFAAELRDPIIRDRLIALAVAETGGQPGAQQAFIETVLNRAAARGQTLKETIRVGYYPRLGNTKTLTNKQRQNYGEIIRSIQAGSNVSKYATGNASKDVGFGKSGYKTIDLDGEKFGVEGKAADHNWVKTMQAGEAETADHIEMPAEDMRRPPTSMNTTGGGGGGGIDVNIYVHDGRISVQKSAAKGNRSGDPNRMYGNK